MDLDYLRKLTKAQIENDNKIKQIASFNQAYNDQKQQSDFANLERLQPLINVQEQIKETIDEKQDRLIAKLTNNQKRIESGLENIYLTSLPNNPMLESDKVKKQKIPTGYQPNILINPSVANIDNNFSEEELNILNNNFRLPKPSEIMLEKYSNDIINDILTISIKARGKLNCSNNGLKNRKHKNYEQMQKIEYNEKLISILKKYEKRVGSLPEGNKILGRGIRKHKQPKRQAYKIIGGSYGKLNINMPLLLNEMLLQVLKNGQVIYEDKADKSLIDLLTKRFNPNKKYSNKAIQIFNNLNMLANIPSHKSSKKQSLIGSSIFTNANDMMKRLTLLTGSLKAGNTNLKLRNEVWQIIDALLKLGHITKAQHDQYIKKHLI